MGGWGSGTGLAGWETGCLVHIAGFHSWAEAAEKREGKGLECHGTKPFSGMPGLPSPLPAVPEIFYPQNTLPTQTWERLSQMPRPLLLTSRDTTFRLSGLKATKLSFSEHPAP